MPFSPVAVFFEGKPVMVDHTPTSAVAAGDVVVVAAQLRIAHNDIAANALGALADGGGVYKVPKSSAGSSAIPAGTVVYWDASAKQITASSNSGANLKFGTTVNVSVDADTTQYALHIAN